MPSGKKTFRPSTKNSTSRTSQLHTKAYLRHLITNKEALQAHRSPLCTTFVFTCGWWVRQEKGLLRGIFWRGRTGWWSR
ncbi:MAG: hypothetical protein R2788_24725 [Saprospiraceae bacterium]